MADIQQYLDQIAKAEQGEDVRWSIHDSIEKINQEVGTATSIANASKTAAENAATRAAQAAAEANTAADAVIGETYISSAFLNVKNINRYVDYKKLGDTITEEQLADIRSGKFEIVKLGSRIGPFVIVDINYYSSYPKPHVIAMYEGVIHSGSMVVDVEHFRKGEPGFDVYGDENKPVILNTIHAAFPFENCVPELGHLGVGNINTDTGAAVGTLFYSKYWIPTIAEFLGYFPQSQYYPWTGRYKQYSLYAVDNFKIPGGKRFATSTLGMQRANMGQVSSGFLIFDNNYSTPNRPVLHEISYSASCYKTIACVVY